MRLLKIMALLVALLQLSHTAQAQVVKTKRTNADELLEMAEMYYKNRNYYKAIQLCKQGLQKRPDYVDIHFLLGRSYVQVSKYDSARLEFQYVLHEVPRYRDAYLHAMNMELKIGRNQEALCYVDDALYFFPNDREFMLKKLAILETLRYYKYSDNYAQRLVNKYPEDTVLMRYFLNYKRDHAALYMRNGNMAQARYDYEKVLEMDPGNREALEAITNIELRSGNYENSLAFVNRGLIASPDNYDLLLKKMGLLEEMKRYPEAIDISNRTLALFPGDGRLRRINQDLRMAAGRFYLSTDPYIQFQTVLERDASNLEALRYVTNLSYQRGLYEESLNWTNRALRYYPNDRNFLDNKVNCLEKLGRYGAAAAFANQLWRQNRTADNEQRYLELKIRSGRQYMEGADFDSALVVFDEVLRQDPNNPQALNYSINVMAGQKRYDDAIALIDRSLTFYPNDALLQFKKANLLTEAKQYEDAGNITFDLITRFPENDRYVNAFVDQRMQFGRELMQQEEYDEARDQFKAVLQFKPNELEALNYLVNLESAQRNFDTALMYADRGLVLYPNNKDLLLKKSSILEQSRRYQEAYTITSDLSRRYPYNSRLRSAYVEQLLANGRVYQRNQQFDSALVEFKKVLELNPRDSNALAYTANIYNSDKRYDSALKYVDQALGYYPGNDFFTMKRAVIMENTNQFDLAVAAADSVRQRNPGNLNYADYVAYLKSRNLKNQLGLQFLYTTFDDGTTRTHANIATFQYIRFLKKMNIGGRLNYAGRVNGTGIQLEGEVYYKHDSLWTSYLNLGIANQTVFPTFKGVYSIYRQLPRGYEGELGVRFLTFPIFNTTSLTGVAGAAKYYGDFWLNLRGNVTRALDRTFFGAQLTGRQYLSTKSDFLSATFGFGNSPDDFSRIFQLPQVLGFNTYNIGAGYQKVFVYRNTLGIYGNWYNMRTGPGTFRNQYDIFVQFLRKF